MSAKPKPDMKEVFAPVGNAFARLTSKERGNSRSASQTRNAPAAPPLPPPPTLTLEQSRESIKNYVHYNGYIEAETLTRDKRVRVMLPKALVRDCVLKFNFDQSRILFGRDDKWKYYELENIGAFNDGEAVVKAHCNISATASDQAKDFVAIQDAICSLTMKGLPSPFVFRFDTVEEKACFLRVVKNCLDYFELHKVTEESLPTQKRTASNSVRMTVEDSQILTGGAENEGAEGRQASSGKWSTRPTTYWRSTG